MSYPHHLCWLRGQDGLCDGPLDRAHIGLTKQYLKQKGVPYEDRWDPRIWRVCCRAHHHKLDQGFIKLRRDQLPPSVEQYAAEHNLEHRLTRDFGPRPRLIEEFGGEAA